MTKTTFQRLTTKRVLTAAPNLRFIAFYHRDEERLNACMQDYEGRCFVYVLSALHEGKECFLYAGKSKAQYARCLIHSKQIAYDHIYLFECEPEQLVDSEKAVIRELTPLFNRMHNPKAERIKLVLNMDYDAVQDEEKVHQYLERYLRYEEKGLFGFALPGAVYLALEKETAVKGCTCSEMVQRIMEKELGSKVAVALEEGEHVETNLDRTKDYANRHEKSAEQIKQYMHQKGRVSGALRIGRDWVIPKDAEFPEDLRGKQKGRKACEKEALRE